jgi:alpha-amylase/alpha-mannosidase (GH57 family)
MNDLVFLFAVHNHQPVGNFPSVFRSAFEDCYRPLLRGLARHPGFRFALHFSGPLWEFMEKSERDCWDLVRELTGRDRSNSSAAASMSRSYRSSPKKTASARSAS